MGAPSGSAPTTRVGAAQRDADPGQQPAAAHPGQHRVQRAAGLAGQLGAGGPGPQDGLGGVVGVHPHRPGRGLPFLAELERLGVGGTADHQVGAVGPDPGHLGRRGHLGHEDPGRDSELARRVGHRGAVVAARRRHHAGRRDLAQQQVGERAAGLERPGVLQLLQLEQQRPGRQPEVGQVHADHRGPPDVRRDQRVDLPYRIRRQLARTRHARLPAHVARGRNDRDRVTARRGPPSGSPPHGPRAPAPPGPRNGCGPSPSRRA